ncbi:tripartite tricarboxylate transporter TctB family protein [Ammoniphilus sp. YIM 78166]|uniref:tripartite tricarboxylate transporter TctB family protein n=1 Tax=Ammoniphilus sp. YIM 78166 TaxID=1644106 RepID=UPI0010704BAD|nr:tripartite tricarboxylate transporter TctB family protein [Ammoniphilus sp. YIM 78166]
MKTHLEEKVTIACLTLIALAFLIICFQAKSFASIRVPLLILIPTFLGLLWQLGKAWIPAWKEWTLQKQKSNDEAFRMDAEVMEETSEEKKRRLHFSLWLVFVTALVYYLGFIYAIFASLLFYFRVLARFPWLKSIYATAGYLAFLYLFFVVFLKMDLL